MRHGPCVVRHHPSDKPPPAFSVYMVRNSGHAAASAPFVNTTLALLDDVRLNQACTRRPDMLQCIRCATIVLWGVGGHSSTDGRLQRRSPGPGFALLQGASARMLATERDSAQVGQRNVNTAREETSGFSSPCCAILSLPVNTYDEAPNHRRYRYAMRHSRFVSSLSPAVGHRLNVVRERKLRRWSRVPHKAWYSLHDQDRTGGSLADNPRGRSIPMHQR
jgi:hypothetical protein